MVSYQLHDGHLKIVEHQKSYNTDLKPYNTMYVHQAFYYSTSSARNKKKPIPWKPNSNT